MNAFFKNRGLTLIEVLIALAIISIAFAAIIVSTSQTIRNTAYLQNKMMAGWVGIEIINRMRAGLLNSEPQALNGEIEWLGKKWFWKASTVSTLNPKIHKIQVQVSPKETNKNITSWISYVYQN